MHKEGSALDSTKKNALILNAYLQYYCTQMRSFLHKFKLISYILINQDQYHTLQLISIIMKNIL